MAKFPFLRVLKLNNNQLNGSSDQSVGTLSNLRVLDMSSNRLEGVITEAHLWNLSMLYLLDFSFNSVSLDFCLAWVPQFHLHTIRLSSSKLGSSFPQWLQIQNSFSWLEMSNAGISDTIPGWFRDLSFQIDHLNLSHNQIKGTIPRQ